MNWFTDKLYDLGASPKAGEAAWGELAAQDAMSPATRSSYYAGSEMPPDPRAQGWAPDAEKTFQAGIRATPWFAEFKQKFGEEPNLNDPDYDYRRAWAAGARPTVRDPGDNLLHWSSQFKGENHPNRFVNGIDTITGKPQMSSVADPGTADWMLPPQGPPTWEAAHRFGASGLTPPPARSAADAYRMGGLANMDEYKPNTFREIDRQAIEDQYGGADIHGIKLPPVSQSEPRAWFNAVVPQTPAEIGLAVATGPAGRVLGKVGRAVVGATGMMGELVDPAEAGALSKAGKTIGSLFDYSRIRDVPDVKQFDLPRYVPPRGVSERVQGLVGNEPVQREMLDYIQKGKDINAQTFYYNEPLRQAFIDELGKKKGQQGFERYMDYVAATSPRSDVETNARNASYYYMLEKQGLPVPPQGGVNPQPYGHMAQNLHRENAEKIRSGEYFDVTKNPKPLSFSQNLQGNFAPVTVDAHAFKLPAMLARDPNFIAGSIKLEKGQPTINPSKMLASGEITMEDAFKRPVYWASKPNPNEYAAMEQYYKRLAAETGMTPAQVQAAAWAGGGKVTGLESVAGDPFMRSVENRAIKTAAERGISPAEALSQMMRGKAPLLGTAGAVPLGAGMMGGIADQNEYNYR